MKVRIQDLVRLLQRAEEERVACIDRTTRGEIASDYAEILNIVNAIEAVIESCDIQIEIPKRFQSLIRGYGRKHLVTI